MPQYTPLDLVFGDIYTEARSAHVETQYKLAVERSRPLGGSHNESDPSTTYVDAVGAIVVPIAYDTTAKLRVMCFVEADTGTFRLVDLGAAAAIGITSSSVANPTVITTDDDHDIETGDTVLVAGHSGSTPDINGSYTATKTGDATLTIPVNVTVGGTGGTVLRTSSREVADSETTFTETTPTLKETADLELVAGAQYKLQVKISDAASYVMTYGAALVTQ